MGWKITAKPEGRNGTATPEKNEGGLVVRLVNGGYAQEVGRVAFERKNSTHPDVSYPEQVKVFVDTAKATVATINELVDESGTLQ